MDLLHRYFSGMDGDGNLHDWIFDTTLFNLFKHSTRLFYQFFDINWVIFNYRTYILRSILCTLEYIPWMHTRLRL